MKYESLLSKAESELKIADHIVYVTLPVIHDKQLFRSVIVHISRAFVLTMSAFLEHELVYKRITGVPEDADLVARFFVDNYSLKFGFSKEDEKLLSDLRSIVKVCSGSEDFERGGKFFMVSPSYRILGFDVGCVKLYLKFLKELYAKVKGGCGKIGF